MLRRSAPVLAGRFLVPTRRDITPRLLGGAALFGLGWGLAGYCPGPAIASVGKAAPQVLVFILAMTLGMVGMRWVGDARARGPSENAGELVTPSVKAFFDPTTNTLSYVAWDPETRDAVVIDPVLDFHLLRIAVSQESVDTIIAFVRENDLTVHYVIDTHAHADHMSGQRPIAEALGAKTAIGEHITGVQGVFKTLLDLDDDFPTDGSQWDLLLAEGSPVRAGSLWLEPIHTPGHTPACMTLKIGDALFTGDTMFMPDFGTGRCDFPGGSAEALYDSIKRLYELPDETRVYVGHDYQPGGRPLAWETTIGAAKRENIQLRSDTAQELFVTWRAERDAKLEPPRLIFPSLQVNAAAGALPPAHANGRRYLRLPMNVF